MNKLIENNQVSIIGKVSSELKLDHEVHGEKFYKADVIVERLSGVADVIPVIISDYLIDDLSDYAIDSYISVLGQFRSYNKNDDGKLKLILSVFANEITFINEEDIVDEAVNNILLDGYVCKPPIHRTTPLGREITDVFLAVNRPYGKSDYIPCVCWGRLANFASRLNIGTNIQVAGRIQSREYTKKISGNESEKRVAYEVSIGTLQVVRE